MLTIEDIRNPELISGFANVHSASRGTLGGARARNTRWRARLNMGAQRNNTDLPHFSGPVRKTPEEAAQDYCDYVNGGTLVTIEDIRNPSRKSGFDHVSTALPGRSRDPKDNTRPIWRAQGQANPEYTPGSGLSRYIWRGPSRSLPEEAAQDYCDYVNGQTAQVASEQWELTEIDMGNSGNRHAPKAEPVKVTRKKFTGPHDLYDVELLAPVTKKFVVRKVGVTATGRSRYLDICRTFGFTIRPVNRAITYQTEAKARQAENDLIAKLCTDKNWKRVGKEAFVPAEKVNE